MLALREATSTDQVYVASERTFEEAQKLRNQPNATAKRAAIEKYKEAQRGLGRPAILTVSPLFFKWLALLISN